jgi:ABC-type phosphate transport system substrate-binding protein
MDMSSRKRILSGPLALVVGVGAFLAVSSCGVLASTSALAYTAPAGLPPAGLNCVASDGKIDGRGSSYQEEAQQKTWALAYTQDFCGEVAELPENTERTEKDPAGHTMVAYNYPAAKEAKLTGSGNGNKGSSCRSDDFTGTDNPYTNQELATVLDGPVAAAGEETACKEIREKLHQVFYNPLSPWPNAGDHQAKIMSFPIAGSSVALPINLKAANCEGHTPPTAINLTGEEASKLLGGVYLHWNEAALVATNPGLEHCTAAVTRVVRALTDSSGTTTITKSYFVRVENARAGECGTGVTWQHFFEHNTEWPEGGEHCSALVRPTGSGNGEVLAQIKAHEASVGYVDLPQAINQGLTLANVRNATNTSFQSPNVGTAANCNYGVLTLPGVSPEEAVGLNLKDNWSNNNEKTVAEGGNEKPQHGIATDLGAKYPICGLTWDLVYTHMASSADAEVANSRVTSDQRRTLYSYFTFILSSAGQDLLNEAFYAPLPSAWIPTLREGFQNNF